MVDFQEIVFKEFTEQLKSKPFAKRNEKQKYLAQHFYRECKNAKAEFYEAEEFFDKCVKEIAEIKTRIAKERTPQFEVFEKIIDLARSGKLDYENDNGKPKEQRWRDTIAGCERQLKSIENATISLYNYTNGRFHGQLKIVHLSDIIEAINEARERVNTENESPRPKAIQPTFSDYLTAKGKPYLEKILAAYANNTKACQIRYLLIALHEEGMLTENLEGQGNQTALVKAIENTFSTVGTRQNFNIQLKRELESLEGYKPTLRVKINAVKRKLKN